MVEKVWKGAVVAYLKVLSSNTSRRTEETYNTLQPD
jgi:hypothetical protein